LAQEADQAHRRFLRRCLQARRRKERRALPQTHPFPQSHVFMRSGRTLSKAAMLACGEGREDRNTLSQPLLHSSCTPLPNTTATLLTVQGTFFLHRGCLLIRATARMLRDLFCLAIADVCGFSPQAWCGVMRACVRWLRCLLHACSAVTCHASTGRQHALFLVQQLDVGARALQMSEQWLLPITVFIASSCCCRSQQSPHCMRIAEANGCVRPERRRNSDGLPLLATG
jgi:hypothetical protein